MIVCTDFVILMPYFKATRALRLVSSLLPDPVPRGGGHGPERGSRRRHPNSPGCWQWKSERKQDKDGQFGAEKSPQHSGCYICCPAGVHKVEHGNRLGRSPLSLYYGPWLSVGRGAVSSESRVGTEGESGHRTAAHPFRLRPQQQPQLES